MMALFLRVSSTNRAIEKFKFIKTIQSNKFVTNQLWVTTRCELIKSRSFNSPQLQFYQTKQIGISQNNSEPIITFIV